MRTSKIDKDAVHTTVTIAFLSTLLGGLVSVGVEELKAYLKSRREKAVPTAPAKTPDETPVK